MEQIHANNVVLLDGGDVSHWCLFESGLIHIPSLRSLFLMSSTACVMSTLKNKCNKNGIKVGAAKPDYNKFLMAARRAEAIVFISKDIDKIRRYLDFAFELHKPIAISNGQLQRIYGQD